MFLLTIFRLLEGSSIVGQSVAGGNLFVVIFECNGFTIDSDCFATMSAHCLWLQRIQDGHRSTFLGNVDRCPSWIPSCSSSYFRHNPQILFFLTSYVSLHSQTHLMSSKTMQWRWEKYDVTVFPSLNICIQVLDKKCFVIESGGEVVVAGEVVFVVAEVVGGEWENISHRLLILLSPPHSVRPVSH